jgi:4-hydroxy-tetrahydrodipicolinate synthase
MPGAKAVAPITLEQCRRRLERGLIPAVPVPFRKSGELDADAQRRYIASMAKQPVAGVAVWAHTGRGLRLSREQRVNVLQAWTQGLGEGKLIVAGVGAAAEQGTDFLSYVSSALEMAGDALEHRAHALLVYPPGPFRHAADCDRLILDYHGELASLGAPLILFYLYEAAGGVSYSFEVLRSLLALPEVVGIKVATLDSVMTFQNIANLVAKEFPRKVLITGEDRFLGYSLMCGARAALIGMGAACTKLQHRLLDAHFSPDSKKFLSLSKAVDRLAQVLFIPPMEGYIRRMLWALVHCGVLSRESAHDPWGPELPEAEFAELGKTLRDLGEISRKRKRK